MKFAVIGGDRRSVLLCRLLLADGHRVYTYALEKAELPANIPKIGCLQGCIYGADVAVMPVPAERSGFLNAPLAEENLSMEEIVSALWPGQLLCGGKFSEELNLAAMSGGVQAEDILLRQDFAVGNADITAEAALSLLMENSEKTLRDSRVLVCGWGRIAKLLALRLKSLGASVSAAARRAGSRAMAESLGIKSMDICEIPEYAGDFEFIVNTVPAEILKKESLCCLREGSLILELASGSGGFDRTLAENIGLKVLYAPGLPGKYAPLSAAELIKKTIYSIIREREI